MALVQYDYGTSESETENEDSETTEVTKPVESQPTQAQQKRVISKTTANETDKDQVSKKIKIAIPKIIDDKIEDDISDEAFPRVSRINNFNETSGLLTKLPAPKCAPKKVTTTSFVPHAVNRKPVPDKSAAANKAKMLAKAKAAKKLKEKEGKTEIDELSSILDGDKDDSDDDIDDLSSISTNFDEDMWKQVCGRRSKATKKAPPTSEEIISDPSVLGDLPEQPEAPSLKLDNDAFKQLVGASKRRQIPSDITITDIDESDMLEKTDVWMRKALTDPQYLQPRSTEDESTNPVAKNKHHITFLAQQAKAKEQELQAQWASGNQKRQMSRAKYGF